MDVGRTVVAHSLQVIPLEHVQREQFRRSLTGRTILINLIASIIGKDRLLNLSRGRGRGFLGGPAGRWLQRPFPSPSQRGLCKTGGGGPAGGNAGPCSRFVFPFRQVFSGGEPGRNCEDIARVW